jgi:hypothetical protein
MRVRRASRTIRALTGTGGTRVDAKQTRFTPSLHDIYVRADHLPSNRVIHKALPARSTQRDYALGRAPTRSNGQNRG